VKFALRQRTRLAALRVRDEVLVLQTLLWADEVREAAFPSLDEPAKVSDKELTMSAQLVSSFEADFTPEDYEDEYQVQLRKLVEAKLEAGDTVDTAATFGETAEGESEGAEVVDLMEALKRSVAESKSRSKSSSGSSSRSSSGSSSKSGSTSKAKPRTKSKTQSKSQKAG
jgi:DNA end-binding protein Ku